AVTKGQTDNDGHATRAGLAALTRHVATHTLTLAVVLALIAWRFPLDWSPAAMSAGLAVNAASHAWADHRPNLRRLAVALGKRSYYDMPGGAGSYALDQAWHLGWRVISALIISA
ncbi:transcriptional regulator, partial [Actinomadura livida]